MGYEKVFLGTVSVAVIGVVAAVHIQQTSERDRMHKGVLRDIERLQAKRKLKQEANNNLDGGSSESR